jgi:hypothetical protein
MGTSSCCYLDTAFTQIIVSQNDLIEVFISEQKELQMKIDTIGKFKNVYLNNKKYKKFNSENSKKIKTYLTKIEDSFYFVTLYSSLKWLEERFSNEKYQAFNFIKDEFFSYYKKVKDAFDYSLLIKESQKFNQVLDQNLITPKYIPTQPIE